jgi:hypothetical protein
VLSTCLMALSKVQGNLATKKMRSFCESKFPIRSPTGRSSGHTRKEKIDLKVP